MTYSEILLIVPPSNYSALSNHLAEHYSSASYPRLNIILKKFTDGERDEDDASASGSGFKTGVTETEGTARILKRFRSYIKVGYLRSHWQVMIELTLICRLILSFFRVICTLHHTSASRQSSINIAHPIPLFSLRSYMIHQSLSENVSSDIRIELTK